MRYARMALLLGLMWFTGCGPVITEGDVCGRRFDPEHTIEVDDSYTIYSDPPITIPASHTETVPDRFYITFRKMDESTNEWIKREVQVDRETHNRLQDGDHFSIK